MAFTGMRLRLASLGRPVEPEDGGAGHNVQEEREVFVDLC